MSKTDKITLLAGAGSGLIMHWLINDATYSQAFGYSVGAGAFFGFVVGAGLFWLSHSVD